MRRVQWPPIEREGAQLTSKSPAPKRDPRGLGPTALYITESMVAIAVGMPFALVGLAVGIGSLGILWPVAVLFLGISGLPLGWVTGRRTEAIVAWDFRDHVMSNDELPPWLMEE